MKIIGFFSYFLDEKNPDCVQAIRINLFDNLICHDEFISASFLNQIGCCIKCGIYYLKAAIPVMSIPVINK